MVPDNGEKDYKKISDAYFGSTNYYQPIECLGGHCVIEFVLGNNAVVENSHWRSPLRNKDSYFDNLMKGSDVKNKMFLELMKYTLLAAEKTTFLGDLSMRNIVQQCLDFDKPQAMWDKANYFLDTILNEPPNWYHHSILMGLWDNVIEQEAPLKSYGKFWVSTDMVDRPHTSYAKIYSLPAWAYQIVPLNGEVPNSLIVNTPKLQEEFGQPIARMDSSSIVLDIVMEKDAAEDESVKKEFPIKHFYLDFRFMMLKRKLNKIYSKEWEPDMQSKQTLTLYDLSLFFSQLKDAYGDNIEMQRDVRNTIDAIFDTTKYIMKVQFVLYTAGYILPLLL